MLPDPVRIVPPRPHARLFNGIAQRDPLPDGSLTIQHVCDVFLANTARDYSPDALAERQRVIRQFCADFGERFVADCQPHDLVLWIGRHTEWKSQWTIRSVAQCLVRVFNWAAKLRLIAENPFAGVRYEDGEPRRPMTDDEFLRLLRNTDALFRRLLFFLRWTGCRPGELARIEWPDVDLVQGVVVLQKHKSRKKTRKPRIIVLPVVAQRLLAWLRRRGHGTGRVFVTRRGTPWNRCNLSLRIQRLRGRAGVAKDCFLYGLRHAFGTNGVANGAPLKLLSEAMGHSSVQVTERFYVDLRTKVDAIRAAVERVNGRQ